MQSEDVLKSGWQQIHRTRQQRPQAAAFSTSECLWQLPAWRCGIYSGNNLVSLARTCLPLWHLLWQQLTYVGNYPVHSVIYLLATKKALLL